jgi:hypothetical protein
MSFWTDLRDTAESGAVLAGNYLLPGSSLVTSKLVSEGSQKQLGSTVGQLAQLGTGGAGALEGNLANYSTAYDKAAGLFGGGEAMTGQQAVEAFNSGKISAAEFEALAQGAGTTGQGLLSGTGLGATISKYAVPAAIFGSSLIGADAAKSAAATQAQATAEANRVAYQMYQEQKALQEPYRAAGVTGQNKLLELMGLGGDKTSANYGKYAKDFSMSDFTADPGYAFRLSEGQKALERSAAARGGLLSGATGKALTRFGQDYGSQEYTNAFNRYQTNRANQLNPLGSLITSGQNAAANTGSAAGTYGATVGSNTTSGAAATAAGQVGSTNALTGGLNTYLNYSSNQDLVNALTRRSTYA